jgi:neutral ceramidase
MFTLLAGVSCFLALLLLPKRVLASSSLLSAGVARADITPDPAMINWVDQKPYDGVLDPLHVRALSLTDGETDAALICLDVIDVTEEALVGIRRAVHASTGIPESNVLVSASHTHSGPRSPFSAASLSPGRAEKVKIILEDPVFQSWAKQLPEACAAVAKKAAEERVEVTVSIGRADAGQWLFNRRPIDPEGNVVSTLHPDNPNCLSAGLRFGVVDPTLTAVRFQDSNGKSVSTLFSVPCHSVSIYPFHRGISADWPGFACKHIAEELGGEALFLQGCAGDIVPGRRGEDERAEMSRFFAERAVSAARVSHSLSSTRLQVSSGVVGLPLTQEARENTGSDIQPVEIQVVNIGEFALVTLPGEPLNGIAAEIQARSPFPHTLVVGYTNGRGVGYVGLPGEKARGGYEASHVGRGTDEAGKFLIETAVRLLEERSDG